MSSLIELSNITKSYQSGDQTLNALDHINLSIDHGEFIAIMGESGAGKSTAMDIIGLLDEPTSGSYILDSINTNELSDNQKSKIRNEQIGFVFQSFFLLPRLNVIQNIALPLSYRGVNRTEAHALSYKMLEKLNMTQLAHKKPNEMSGGQQQRVAIARALVGNPNVILADEPTGALDSQTGTEIMALFSNLFLNEKKTVIMVTHDPIISSYCHRVIILKDGRIAADFENKTPGHSSIRTISELFLQTSSKHIKYQTEQADEI